MSASEPSAACTCGSPATQAPAATATAVKATATATVSRPVRYSEAGNSTTKKRASSRQAGSWEPVTACLPRLTSIDSRATSDGSGAEDRTTDRWVDTRWYSDTSSSASVALSCRRRASFSSRAHSAECAVTKASTSTVAA